MSNQAYTSCWRTSDITSQSAQAEVKRACSVCVKRFFLPNLRVDPPAGTSCSERLRMELNARLDAWPPDRPELGFRSQRHTQYCSITGLQFYNTTILQMSTGSRASNRSDINRINRLLESWMLFLAARILAQCLRERVEYCVGFESCGPSLRTVC